MAHGCRWLHLLLSLLLPAEVAPQVAADSSVVTDLTLVQGAAVTCSSGSEVRYFYGAEGENVIDVGNPPIGRVHCLWEASRAQELPTTCPFHLRKDKGGANVDNLEFDDNPTGKWPCAGPTQEGGRDVHNYCWYSSTIASGPDVEGVYALADGSKLPAYLVFAGHNGDRGACNGNVHGQRCTHPDVSWDCPMGYRLRSGALPGPTGCQKDFCDTDSFSAACCVPFCSGAYGKRNGNCPRGTFGGSYTETCAAHDCTAADEESCCQKTSTCFSGSDVEVFGFQSNGDFINIGSPVTGRVHCLWDTEHSPPSKCPLYERLDSGDHDESDMRFSDDPIKYVNCAHEGGTGARQCWYPASIKRGPTVLDMYDTNEGEFNIPWYKIYVRSDHGWAACNQGGFNCGTQAYNCSEVVTGGKAKDGAKVGPGGCQASFCDVDTFAEGCCDGQIVA